MMTKYDMNILLLLSEKKADNSYNALSIVQIQSAMSDKQRKAYSTTYRHLGNMEDLGYVKCGLSDGLASTYYLTESGKLIVKAN